MKLIFYTNQAGTLYLTKVETTSTDTEIVLPGRINNQVYNIGACAFYGNEHIEKIVIPEEVQAIGAYAFGKCAKLTRLLFEREFPPSFDYDSFTRLAKPVTCECYKGSGTYYANAYYLTADYDSTKKAYTNITHYENNIVKERRNVLPLQYAGEDLSQIVIGGSVSSIGEMAYMDSVDVSAEESQLEDGASYFSIDSANTVFKAFGEQDRALYEDAGDNQTVLAVASTYKHNETNATSPMVYTYQIDKSLGKNAFYNRESFSNTNNNAILYLNGKKIDSLALQSVAGISQIIIGKDVEYIAESAFFNMPYLSRITLEEGQENFAIEYNGTILLDKAKTKILWANNITSSIQQPSGIGWSYGRLEDFLNSYTTISSLPPYFCQNFFDNYNEDTVLIFPDNIKTIGYKAFEKAEFGYKIADDVELQQGALIAAKNKS